jgi:hypothetical protein
MARARKPRLFAVNADDNDWAAWFTRWGLTGLAYLIKGEYTNLKALDSDQRAIAARVCVAKVEKPIVTQNQNASHWMITKLTGHYKENGTKLDQ